MQVQALAFDWWSLDPIPTPPPARIWSERSDRMISLFEAKQAAKKSTEMKERERPLHAESGPDCRPSLISFIHLSQTAINKIQRKIYMRGYVRLAEGCVGAAPEASLMDMYLPGLSAPGHLASALQTQETDRERDATNAHLLDQPAANQSALDVHALLLAEILRRWTSRPIIFEPPKPVLNKFEA